jgi:hypothetical protein
MTLQKHAVAVRGFSTLLKFSAWLRNLTDSLTPPPFRLIQIGSAFWQSRVLYVATRLDIATVLADGTLAVEAIAGRVAADPDALYRMLRLLTAMGIFEETTHRHFTNNRVSGFLRADNPENVRAMILMHNSQEMSRPWYEQFETGVRSGKVPFRLAHGEELYSYMDTHPEFDALFTQAMDSVEALTGDSFATDFDWGRFGRIIDIGGSRGSKSLAILKRHSGLRALVVDRARVVQGAARHWQGKEDDSVLARMTFQAGDVLESVPDAETDRDIYLLSAVLHGFDDETCIRMLRNLVDAARAAGACIAIMEVVMPESGTDPASASFDLQMFAGTRGRERTLREWQALFVASGAALGDVVSLRSFGKILVIRPGV